MHETLGDAWVAIRGDGAKFPPDVKGVVEKGLGDVAKKGAEILGGMFIGAKFVEAAKAGLAELKEEAATTAQVEAALQSTGNAAGTSAEHIGELSKQLMGLSGTDDEVIAKGQTLLLSFQDVRNEVGKGNDVFDRATAAGLDLAARGFGSVEGNAKLLGIALSDPEKGLTRLRRAGIVLTDQQIASIKGFEATGDKLSAQKVLLDAVEAKVGGAAAAYGETLPGKLAIAHESLKNAEAQLVSGAAPALELFSGWVTTAAGALEHLPGPLQTIISITATAGVGFVALARPLGAVIQLYDRFFGAAKAAAAAEELEAGATITKAGATEAAAAAESKAILSGLGLSTANAAVGATAEGAAAAEGELAAASGLSGAAMLGLVGVVAAVGLALYEGISHAESFKLSLKGVTDVQLDQMLDKIVAGAKLTGRSMYEVGKSLPIDEAIRLADSLDRNHQSSTEVRRAVADMTQAEKDQRDASQKAEAQIRNTTSATDAAQPSLDDLRNSTEDLTDAEKQLVAAADEATAAHDGFASFVGELAGAMDKSYNSLLAGTEATATYDKAINTLQDSLAKNGTSLDVVADKTGRYSEKALANQDAVIGVGQSIAKLIEQHFEETHSVDAAVEAGDGYVQNLRDQLEAAGYNTDQIDRMIQTMHLTPEDIRTTFTNNAIEQQIVVGKYIAQLKDVPVDVRSKIEAEIEAGQLDLANRQLDDIAHGRTVYFNPEIIPKDFHPVGAGAISFRAAGGPVYAGHLYGVNEDGSARPELFAPAVDGTILSADRLESALRSGSSALAMAGASSAAQSSRSGPLVNIENWHAAPDSGLADLDWFAATKLAGI